MKTEIFIRVFCCYRKFLTKRIEHTGRDQTVLDTVIMGAVVLEKTPRIWDFIAFYTILYLELVFYDMDQAST